MDHMIGIITIQQFSLISGLKRFGDRGKHAVTNELTQLHDKKKNLYGSRNVFKGGKSMFNGIIDVSGRKYIFHIKI